MKYVFNVCERRGEHTKGTHSVGGGHSSIVGLAPLIGRPDPRPLHFPIRSLMVKVSHTLNYLPDRDRRAIHNV